MNVANIKDSLSVKPKANHTNIREWSQEAGRIWAECFCVEKTSINEDDAMEEHRCELVREEFEKASDTIKDDLWLRRRKELDEFFFTYFYNNSKIVFFESRMSYSKGAQYTIICSATLHSQLSMPTDQAVQIVAQNTRDLIKVDFNPENKILSFTFSYRVGCNLIDIPFQVYLKQRTSEEIGDDISSGWIEHICMPKFMRCEMGPEIHRDGIFYESKDGDLIGCKETGTLHLCGTDNCDRKERSKTGTGDVCKRTGRMFSSAAGIQDPFYIKKDKLHWEPIHFKTFSKNPASVTNMTMEDLVQQNRNFGDFENLLDSDMTDMNDIYSRKSEIKDISLLFLAVAMKKMTALFSDKRMEYESLQKIQAYNSNRDTQLNRYEARLSSQEQPIDILAEYTIMTNIRNKGDAIILGKIDSSARKQLVNINAHKVIILWWIILTKTKYGEENPHLFEFQPFILAALLMFNDGFKLPTRKESEDTQFNVGGLGKTPNLNKIETIIVADELLQTWNVNGAIETYNELVIEENKQKSLREGGSGYRSNTLHKKSSNKGRTISKTILRDGEEKIVLGGGNGRNLVNISPKLTSLKQRHGGSASHSPPALSSPMRRINVQNIKITKKAIETALKRAFYKENVNPKILQIDNYTFSDVTTDIFYIHQSNHQRKSGVKYGNNSSDSQSSTSSNSNRGGGGGDGDVQMMDD